ncbi:MAG: aminotransferase class V-fold PLP-dependent enzyme [Ignavibacteria bacterium]|jgi:selenocysteine lyase/cysteine desulfurase
MEKYFEKFRKNTIGNNQIYTSSYGKKRMIYADWVASGRLYRPIEKRLMDEVGPYVANTHTETSETGMLMTNAYHTAHHLIKEHINANKDDVIITAGFGMTTVINKFQRILGLKKCQNQSFKNCRSLEKRPVVFITHMEHHSNHTAWFETFADVVQIQPDRELLVDLNDLEVQLTKYKDRPALFGSFTACSNVTGIETPYYEMAKLMHKYGGYCFIDFAASAPYVDINMHPADPEARLDAVFFSPHKFLGGPGSSGVIVFNSSLYQNYAPDQPGGGTVWWTNPWGEFSYLDDIEAREDGGTPGFLQAMKTAMCIGLKNEMGVENMRKREAELVAIAFSELRKIPDLHILADNIETRLGIISYYIGDVHFNLFVRLLSDRFGIQVRGGCACAGTYGHYLLNVTYNQSKEITDRINLGDLSSKPGWIRLSLHPTMTTDDLYFTLDAIKKIGKNYKKWSEDYTYDKYTNEFTNKKAKEFIDYKKWFVF